VLQGIINHFYVPFFMKNIVIYSVYKSGTPLGGKTMNDEKIEEQELEQKEEQAVPEEKEENQVAKAAKGFASDVAGSVKKEIKRDIDRQIKSGKNKLKKTITSSIREFLKF